MSLRLIAGRWRGMPIQAPPGRTTRPTLGRVRESLFGILQPWLVGARVLDAYAGSGALGLEALSRGAAQVLFIEQARPAARVLRQNLERLGAVDEAEVLEIDARRVLAQTLPPGGNPFDLLLLDPPYGCGLAAEALERLAVHAHAWVAPEGLVVVQAGRRDPLPGQCGPLAPAREVLYGETRVVFYHLHP